MSETNKLELICFDLDDTLWPIEAVIRRAEQALLEAMNRLEPLKDLSLTEMRSFKKDFAAKHPDIAHDTTQLRLSAMAQLLAHKGLCSRTAKAKSQDLMAVFMQARNQVQLFPSTQTLLRQIAKTYLLASITNGNACLKTIGLAHHFNVIMAPSIAGVRKPNPGIFQQVLEQTQIPAHRALHIGDHWYEDVFGAKRAGLHTLWVNPENKAWPGDQKDAPSGSIGSIAELPGFLKNFHHKS